VRALRRPHGTESLSLQPEENVKFAVFYRPRDCTFSDFLLAP